ncbi:hypothetical protein GGI04_001793 [Coemansia thaxteri]|uniref:Uncharacterized protein n=1 Tax=Coemansia thaxteri TaxID=2663907 RepID=A0A9W8BBS1_9FUNG|nr:hypothetical protein H4R26_006024 [Coemansia thaxteri]KAJ2006700.1 hypothetical protein GGI04_001793 [Coemansia thaxteri]KAJ2469117.1 hypothetical protein EV174_006244 [Coemansia sp. RSA 2320]KAJ2471275.1 hypothetical protein GGI02_002376 [Coemansia sp. RSA 2322]
MLSALKSLSPLSELSEDRVSESVFSCSTEYEKLPLMPTSRECEELEICAQLDRLNARRLDRQCAVRRPRPQRLLNVSAHSASLERIADGLDHLSASDARRFQRALSPHRLREAFLVGIATRLARLDGCSAIAHSSDDLPLTSSSSSPRMQCANSHHPREYMRRVVISSIGSLNRLGEPATTMTTQRFTPRPAD